MARLIPALVVSSIALGTGIWLAFFPDSYLRSAVKYSKPLWNIYGITPGSVWWRFTFRMLGFGMLAFVGVYLYAAFRQPNP